MMENLIKKLKFGQSKIKTGIQNSNVSQTKTSRLMEAFSVIFLFIYFFQMLTQLVK